MTLSFKIFIAEWAKTSWSWSSISSSLERPDGQSAAASPVWIINLPQHGASAVVPKGPVTQKVLKIAWKMFCLVLFCRNSSDEECINRLLHCAQDRKRHSCPHLPCNHNLSKGKKYPSELKLHRLNHDFLLLYSFMKSVIKMNEIVPLEHDRRATQ